MKKKMTLTILLIFSVIFMSTISVLAYSPHFLPGGKNYLSQENFYYESSFMYETVENFLVKPYTTYTFTIPNEYYQEQFSEIVLTFYDNSIEVDDLHLVPNDFTYYDGGTDESFYVTFTTTSDSNYMGMSIEDGRGYFSAGTLHEIQLEEGSAFTGFEPYIEGDLIDTSAPYFQNAGTIISYYDSPITISEIQSALTAYDSVDGDVTGDISLITDGYTSNVDVLGTYQCVFEVSDTSNNTSQVSVDVEVVDVLKPVFSEVSTIQAVYPNSYTTTEILTMLSASDNYDGDISNNIVLTDDGYTSNSSVVGTYNMEFEVTDSSGNTETYVQELEVVDDEYPIISGITTISLGYDETITETEILANINYTDNYDSEANLSIVLESDSYTSNKTILGSYFMTFSVTDSSGNKTTQPVTINVVDEIGPIVYFNSSIIQTYTDTVMELPDFTQLLINTNEIDSEMDYYVTVKYDSYTKNARVPGVYHLKLNLTDDSGDEYNKDLEIRVVERPIDYIHIEEPILEPDLRFFDKFKTYIMGGALSVLLVSSNIVWLVIFKKKP